MVSFNGIGQRDAAERLVEPPLRGVVLVQPPPLLCGEFGHAAREAPVRPRAVRVDARFDFALALDQDLDPRGAREPGVLLLPPRVPPPGE